MLNVLLESRAPRTRRVGSTAVSALLHATLIAGAVALTMPGPVEASGGDDPPPPIYVVSPPTVRPPEVRPPQRDGELVPPREPALPTIAAPDFVPDRLPPIDVGPALPPDQIVIGGPGGRTGFPIGAGDPPSTGGVAGSAMDERLVDRVPRLVGRVLEPRYPSPLREAGVQGRVVVQFVVDTLGRAELGEMQVVESPHALFVESVRAALARYRFSVGEAGGRKVRTRVQLPFDFTLTR